MYGIKSAFVAESQGWLPAMDKKLSEAQRPILTYDAFTPRVAVVNAIDKHANARSVFKADMMVSAKNPRFSFSRPNQNSSVLLMTAAVQVQAIVFGRGYGTADSMPLFSDEWQEGYGCIDDPDTAKIIGCTVAPPGHEAECLDEESVEALVGLLSSSTDQSPHMCVFDVLGWLINNDLVLSGLIPGSVRRMTPSAHMPGQSIFKASAALLCQDAMENETCATTGHIKTYEGIADDALESTCIITMDVIEVRERVTVVMCGAVAFQDISDSVRAVGSVNGGYVGAITLVDHVLGPQ